MRENNSSSGFMAIVERMFISKRKEAPEGLNLSNLQQQQKYHHRGGNIKPGLSWRRAASRR
jgi:hypothetical protein